MYLDWLRKNVVYRYVMKMHLSLFFTCVYFVVEKWGLEYREQLTLWRCDKFYLHYPPTHSIFLVVKFSASRMSFEWIGKWLLSLFGENTGAPSFDKILHLIKWGSTEQTRWCFVRRIKWVIHFNVACIFSSLPFLPSFAFSLPSCQLDESISLFANWRGRLSCLDWFENFMFPTLNFVFVLIESL